jgi:hypothetical protein
MFTQIVGKVRLGLVEFMAELETLGVNLSIYTMPVEFANRGVIAIGSACESEHMRRCAWADTQELFVPYHDEEWGVPVHDDRLLFEMLNLEGAQAGLSWLTILKKRDGYRRAFDNFDAR